MKTAQRTLAEQLAGRGTSIPPVGTTISDATYLRDEQSRVRQVRHIWEPSPTAAKSVESHEEWDRVGLTRTRYISAAGKQVGPRAIEQWDPFGRLVRNATEDVAVVFAHGPHGLQRTSGPNYRVTSLYDRARRMAFTHDNLHRVRLEERYDTRVGLPKSRGTIARVERGNGLAITVFRTEETYQYDEAIRLTVKTTSTEYGRPPADIRPRNSAVTLVQKYVFDERGRTTEELLRDPTANYQISHAYEEHTLFGPRVTKYCGKAVERVEAWDGNGSKIAFQDANGTHYSLEHDAHGGPGVIRAHQGKVAGPLMHERFIVRDGGARTRFTLDCRHQHYSYTPFEEDKYRAVKSTGARPVATKCDYDTLGNLVSETQLVRGYPTRVARFIYNAAGGRRQTAYPTSDLGQNAGLVIGYDLDPQNRPQRVTWRGSGAAPTDVPLVSKVAYSPWDGLPSALEIARLDTGPLGASASSVSDPVGVNTTSKAAFPTASHTRFSRLNRTAWSLDQGPTLLQSHPRPLDGVRSVDQIRRTGLKRSGGTEDTQTGNRLSVLEERVRAVQAPNHLGLSPTTMLVETTTSNLDYAKRDWPGLYKSNDSRDIRKRHAIHRAVNPLATDYRVDQGVIHVSDDGDASHYGVLDATGYGLMPDQSRKSVAAQFVEPARALEDEQIKYPLSQLPSGLGLTTPDSRVHRDVFGLPVEIEWSKLAGSMPASDTHANMLYDANGRLVVKEVPASTYVSGEHLAEGVVIDIAAERPVGDCAVWKKTFDEALGYVEKICKALTRGVVFTIRIHGKTGEPADRNEDTALDLPLGKWSSRLQKLDYGRIAFQSVGAPRRLGGPPGASGTTFMVSLERFAFRNFRFIDTVRLMDCIGMTFDACTFSHDSPLVTEGNCDGLQVQNCTFQGGVLLINPVNSSMLFNHNEFATNWGFSSIPKYQHVVPEYADNDTATSYPKDIRSAVFAYFPKYQVSPRAVGRVKITVNGVSYWAQQVEKPQNAWCRIGVFNCIHAPKTSLWDIRRTDDRITVEFEERHNYSQAAADVAEKGTADIPSLFSQHLPVLWDQEGRLRDPKNPTPGPLEIRRNTRSKRVVHRYTHDGARNLQRETYRSARAGAKGEAALAPELSAPEVTQFIATVPQGPEVYADSDGTVDVAYADRYGEHWFSYRAREGQRWFKPAEASPGCSALYPRKKDRQVKWGYEPPRHSGLLSPLALPRGRFYGYEPWHVAIAETDHLMGRRGILGWNGEQFDRGLLRGPGAQPGTFDRLWYNVTGDWWDDYGWGQKTAYSAIAFAGAALFTYGTGGSGWLALGVFGLGTLGAGTYYYGQHLHQQDEFSAAAPWLMAGGKVGMQVAGMMAAGPLLGRIAQVPALGLLLKGGAVAGLGWEGLQMAQWDYSRPAYEWVERFGATALITAYAGFRVAQALRRLPSELFSYYGGPFDPLRGGFLSTTGRTYMTAARPGKWLTQRGLWPSLVRFTRTGRWSAYQDQHWFRTGAEDLRAMGFRRILPRTATFWKTIGRQYETRIGVSGFRLAQGSTELIVNQPITSASGQIAKAIGGEALQTIPDIAAAIYLGAKVYTHNQDLEQSAKR
jgi:hypothetical protein